MFMICAVDIGGKSRNGIAIRNSNGELLYWNYIVYDTKGTPLEHRKKIVNLIQNLYNTYNFDIILYEQVNLFRKGLISLSSIESLVKVQTSILDNFSDKCKIIEIPVRSWKAMVLKDYNGANADKNDAINWVIDYEIDKHNKNINLMVETGGPRKKYLEFNHDMADAIAQSNVIVYQKFINEYLCENSKYNVTNK